MDRFRLLRFSLLLFATVWLFSASAQETTQEGGDKSLRLSASVHGGRFLPYGIYGVRDVYPYWGLRVGHQAGYFQVEWSTFFIVAKEVNLYGFSLSWIFPSQVEDFQFIPFFGVDAYYYRGHTDVRQLPYQSRFGGHIGVSPLVPLSKTVNLRADFKSNFGPGTSLFVGAGVMVQF